MNDYICSVCGAGAYYDGRCGDGPVLICGCNELVWVDEGSGGYYTNPLRATPVKGKVRNDNGRKVR